MSPLIRATPALLDGWCGFGVDDKGGRLIVDGESQTVQDLAGRDYEYQWYGDVALIRVGQDDVSPVLLDLARPEVQDRVCRVLCGESGAVFERWEEGGGGPGVDVYAAGLLVATSLVSLDPDPEDGLTWPQALHLPALATCTTLPEALAVWWAHHVAQETP